MKRVVFLLLLLLGPVVAAPLTPRERALHVLNRFGYGPRPGEVEAVVKEGPDAWFDRQLAPMDTSAVDEQLAEMSTLHLRPGQLYLIYVRGKRAADLRKLGVQVPPLGDILTELSDQKLVRACDSPAQLQEVMADFWENHFNIDWHKSDDAYLLTDYDLHVIRPRALGHFPDLLRAVAHSAAMMDYLDNARSSRLDRRRRGSGINENYARELMELHTLGVRGGYTQHDIIEVARCLTGWTVVRPRAGRLGPMTFRFRPELHDNGRKVVLGHVIPPGGGMRDGEMVLRILAHHPSTARLIAYKLCRRFVSDRPPRGLVERVADVYMRTNGDIRAMLTCIERSPELWASYRDKVKTPFEMVVSSLRAVNGQVFEGKALMRSLTLMGEGLYSCEPPTGYKDTADAWVSSGGLLQRLNFALALAQGRMNGVEIDLEPLLDKLRMMDPQGHGDPRAVGVLAAELLHADVSAATRASLENAMKMKGVDYPKLVGLLLGSPEFQRR